MNLIIQLVIKSYLVTSCWTLQENTGNFTLADENALYCSNTNEQQMCEADCDTVYIECLFRCGQDACLSECAVELNRCIDRCPCNSNCPNGCEHCDNDACSCSNFPSEENDFNGDLCLKINSVEYGECILNCDFEACDERCLEIFKTRNKECPCQVKRVKYLNR